MLTLCLLNVACQKWTCASADPVCRYFAAATLLARIVERLARRLWFSIAAISSAVLLANCTAARPVVHVSQLHPVVQRFASISPCDANETCTGKRAGAFCQHLTGMSVALQMRQVICQKLPEAGLQGKSPRSIDASVAAAIEETAAGDISLRSNNLKSWIKTSRYLSSVLP